MNPKISLAKEAISSYFDKKEIDLDFYLNQDSSLNNKGASFVTLTQDGNLRGCIGTLVAYRNLSEDIISNALSAAFRDYRFLPLSREEFEGIEIEISLLSEPQELLYENIEELKKRLRPRIDGVILISGEKQATFLPQVWDQLPTFELFFSHLCQKAGVSDDCLESHPNIFTYQVEEIKE